MLNMKERENIKNTVSFSFHFILQDVRVIHKHLTHVQFSQERWGRARETAWKLFSPSESMLLYFSNRRSLQKALWAGSRHSHASCKKSTVTEINVNKPWNEQNSFAMCMHMGKVLFFNQGGIFLIQVCSHNYSKDVF